jgi:23S rRNA pseudouridine955/2504/2580 synthase
MRLYWLKHDKNTYLIDCIFLLITPEYSILEILMQKSNVQYIVINSEYTGQRIDNFLITYLKSVPKTRIYRILRKGEVRVNKKRVEPSYRLQANDQVRLPPLHIEERPALPIPSKQLIDLLTSRILFEDKGLLIINKPSGIPVHGGSQVKLGLVEALRYMYPKLPHLELAHRLDSDTSGCLILAKKRGILKEMHDLFRQGKINKIYWALTKGHWKPNELKVEVSLKKNQLSGGERIVRVDNTGKPSITIFRPLEIYKEAMLVEATLLTGRTHQIRVHSQYRKHQIAGDEKYGDREFNQQMRQIGLKRLFLHASIVEFNLPSTNQHIKINAPLDKELEECLTLLE